ncbi:MAG: 2,3-bisphosphoglycerate-independent phosphoglycerate mutase [Polyangiaceae bacterium]
MSLKLSPGKRAARPGPLLCVVMDGVGIGAKDDGDAVHLARTPVLDRLLAQSQHLALAAHGTAVGMPSDDDMGNSEVGHNALGAGRIFDQGAKLVEAAIADGSLFAGEVWQALVDRCRGGGALHFIGLLSDGNVHSHIDHLLAMIRRAEAAGVKTVYVHPLLDGRDVEETSALVYLAQLEEVLATFDGRDGRRFRVASGGGRMLVTMDRYEADWSIVERGWRAHVLGDARRFPSARAAVETFRSETAGVIDQFLPAFVIEENGEPVGPIADGDAVVFFNFRGDRAIEISQAFEREDFTAFDRERRPSVLFAGMMEYDGDLHVPARYLVAPPAIDRTLGQYLAENGVGQLAIAETQKYGHVTYFWNGNCTGLYDPASGRYHERAAEPWNSANFSARVRRSELETFIEVPSDTVPFEQRPWMKAAEVTDALISELVSGRHRFLRVNYANGDMVGHTGDLDAACQAVAAVDLCLGRLLTAVAKLDGVVLVTADHGNADEMFMRDKKGDFKRDATGRIQPKTSHTLNPVPFILFDPRSDAGLSFRQDLQRPGLANVAATILDLLGLSVPEDYHPSLLEPRR